MEITPYDDDNVRLANFALNQEKQVQKIKNDAMLKDFEVVVNNLDENTNIKCSSGFYSQVAKPCFLSLNVNTILNCLGVSVTLIDVAPTFDIRGSELNRVMKFSFFYQSEDLGAVRVHLHHSTRTIQTQGSCLMPDSTKAALWFTNNLIIPRFKDLAKAKKYQIKSYNQAIIQASTSTVSPPNDSSQPININNCMRCNSIFNKQSKPSLCTCGHYFHRTCLTEHKRSCKILPSSSLSKVQTKSLARSKRKLTANPSVEGQDSSINLRAAVTYSEDISIRNDAPPDVSDNVVLEPAPEPIMETLTPIQRNDECLTSQEAPSQIQKQHKATRKKKQVTTENDLNISFLKRELAAAQTRIVQLDSEIDDKNKKISLLESRLKFHEDREAGHLHNQYFSPQSCHLLHVNTCSSNSLPPGSCRCTHSSMNQDNVTNPDISMNRNISSSLENMQKEIKGLKVLVNNLTCLYKLSDAASAHHETPQTHNSTLDSSNSIEALIPDDPMNMTVKDNSLN